MAYFKNCRGKISVINIIWHSRLRTSALGILIAVIFSATSSKNSSEIRDKKSSQNIINFSEVQYCAIKYGGKSPQYYVINLNHQTWLLLGRSQSYYKWYVCHLKIEITQEFWSNTLINTIVTSWMMVFLWQCLSKKLNDLPGQWLIGLRFVIWSHGPKSFRIK